MAEVVPAGHQPRAISEMYPKQASEPASLSDQTMAFPFLEPNPPFVFPAQSSPTISPGSESACPSSSNARGSINRNRPKNLSIHALPAFEFGGDVSGGSSGGKPSPSPTRSSPTRMTPPISTSSGHRRGLSELVGGNAVNPITASDSPTKSDAFESSTQVPPGPPTTHRRGHAHKRSGALSQHDISILLKPSGQSGNGSAPGTPHETGSQKMPRPDFFRASSQNSYTSVLSDGSTFTDRPGSSQNRSRVTFSSDPEYIPRPLSTISSETSSSMSTVRAGHSVTNSITSFASGGTSSPPSAKKGKQEPTKLSGDVFKSRNPESLQVPTSGASIPLGLEQPVEQDFIQRPSSAPPTDHEQQQQQEVTSQSTPYLPLRVQADEPSISSPMGPSTNQLPQSQEAPPMHESFNRPRTSPEPRAPKRHAKVKSLAGLILPKKPKQASHETQPSSNHNKSSILQSPPHSGFSLDSVTFDEDTTCIIENPVLSRAQAQFSQAKSPPWAQENLDAPNEDIAPILDIDAALGSANLSTAGNAPFDQSGGLATSRRRLHSSGETGGFSGPGMHYHRRAESAPELDFFEQGRLGFAHRSSNPAMSEAIEEEEEEEVEAEKDHGDSVEQSAKLGIHIVEAESSEPTARPSSRRPYNRRGHSEGTPDRSDQVAQRYLNTVEIVHADEEPRFSVITKSSDESTITPAPSPEAAGLPATSTPFNFTEPASRSSLGTPKTPGTLPSPDFSKSSFDQSDSLRIHTAHSSITDRTTLNSSRTGDQGLSSVDDVPSLTSSASTMISGHPTRFSSSGATNASFTDPTERSFSLSAPAPARIRSGSSSKRSSLVSLSRLVGNTHNKSKLNIAELAQPDSPEKPGKKRGKRMSRLMFWKSKDKLPLS